MYREPTVMGRKPGLKSIVWTRRKNKLTTRTEWRNKNSNNEERLRNLQDNFKRSNIWIIVVPEGEEQEKETENLFEQIMKENFLNLVKEVDIQVQETQSSKQTGPKEEYTKTHYN